MRNKWEKVKAKVKLVLMVDDDDDQAPSEQDIEDALKILVSRKPELLEDSEGYNRTFRELRNELVPKIDEGITLTDQNSAWKPWLSDMQSSDTWETPRSDSYYQYLVMDKNSSYSTLDYTANEIVKLLADPRRDQPAVSRKGLILGDVQSGKTRTYIALMNKAADCGYRLIIVLTSDNENLRQQTQERIDTDFIGWQDGIRVGIGKYQQNIAHPSQLTNENDFVATYDKAFHSFPRPTWNSVAPCVAVIKKNASILSKFNKWFDSPEFDKDLPVLIIDDESDYASVNSAKLDDSPTRINSLIRDLCQISSRTSYVAVTATPFANIFIDDADESDLFPQDFIHILKSPDAYIGAKKLFGDMDSVPEDSSCVREIDEGELESWLPVSHGKNYDIVDPELDDQVKHAVCTFINACALRPNAEDEQQSMLIHMSRFTDVQRQIADRVSGYLRQVENAVRFHADGDPRIDDLQEAFESEYYTSTDISWGMMFLRIRRLVQSSRLRVRLVNSDSDDWSLRNDVPPDLTSNECTIFIGGNQLSRGMTLSGLICSVFYRRVTASDTLLQMGRWFGYRPNYANLQRIWLLPESVLDYRYSCSIVEELKESASRMKHLGMTPKQFGLAIRKNPNKGVRITNASKMRNAVEGIGYQEFDMAGEIIESIKLDVDMKRRNQNDEAFMKLLGVCNAPQVISSVSPLVETQVFQNVPAKAVVDFLSQYRSGYRDTFFGPTLMTYRDQEIEMNTSMAEQYACTQLSENPDMTWNIGFINGNGNEVEGVNFHWTQVKRKCTFRDNRQFQINGDKMRLGSKNDALKIAACTYQLPIDQKNSSERQYYLTKYFGDHPSLLFYRICVKNFDGHQGLSPQEGPGMLGVKLIVPVDEVNVNKHLGKTVYMYNTVAQRREFAELSRKAEEYGDD